MIWKISNQAVFWLYQYGFLGDKNLNLTRKAHEPKTLTTDGLCAFVIFCGNPFWKKCFVASQKLLEKALAELWNVWPKQKPRMYKRTSEDEIHSRYHLGYLKARSPYRSPSAPLSCNGTNRRDLLLSVGSLCSGMRLASPSLSARTNRRLSESRTGKE